MASTGSSYHACFRFTDVTMAHGSPMRDHAPAFPAPRVAYGTLPRALPSHVLAAFGFGSAAVAHDDPRWLRVALEPIGAATGELWTVDAVVTSGQHGDVRWSRGGGWLYACVEADEAACGGIEAAARHAYAALSAFVADAPERHVQRIWNYLGAINEGAGDDERYKQFCTGRIDGMGDIFSNGYPAASAIGHHAPGGPLQVYLLATDRPGTRVENPRQVSAWQYPRQYGRTPPSFARGTRLPADDVLAISGTAAVVGHASAHVGDVEGQLAETRRNLDALLASGAMPAGFDAQAPLKAYVRNTQDAEAVQRFAAEHWPDAPLVLLHGDICREELLVEIDGWRYRTA
jgi:chorismate lyase / 3-hydroxybenzoate synthase